MRALKIILCIVTALSILAFGLAIYYTQFFKDTIAPEFHLDSNVITVSVKDGDEALGNRTKVKVVKNKMAPPFKKAEFDIVFGEGISHSSELVDLGVELGIIQKSGSWFSYNDSKLAQGREAAKKLLQDNVELADEIEARIRAAMKNVED